MVMRNKPLMIAIGLALGASTSAFAQGTVYEYHTNTVAVPVVTYTPSVDEEHGSTVLNRDTGIRGAASNTNSVIAPASPEAAANTNVYRGDDAAEHAYRSDDAVEHAYRNNDAAAHAYRNDDDAEHAYRDDDARERAERNARATSEEEHGGLRNRLNEKKAEVRNRLGMQPDDD
jgi:hypothetical protein